MQNGIMMNVSPTDQPHIQMTTMPPNMNGSISSHNLPKFLHVPSQRRGLASSLTHASFRRKDTTQPAVLCGGCICTFMQQDKHYTSQTMKKTKKK